MAAGEWRHAVINFNARATEQRSTTLRAKVPGKVILTGKSKLQLNSGPLKPEDVGPKWMKG